MPLNSRPRERLLNFGAENLSDEELLSIILRTGTKNESVKEVSLEILKLIDHLEEMDQLTLNKLMQIKGIGQAKAMSIIAALEFGKRVYLKSDKKVYKITSGYHIYELFKYLYKLEKQENLIVVLLDNKNKIIKSKTVFKGSINISIAHPREIFNFAILNSAYAIIIVHNHPSGDPTPSKNDCAITKQMIASGEIIGIKVIDHIIIGHNKYYTFRENKVVMVDEKKII